MKKILLLILGLLSAPCFAMYNGFSVGIQGGYAHTDNPDNKDEDLIGKGFFGRIYANCQWNTNWAAELGYALTDYTNDQPHHTVFKENESITDLSVKAMLPFNCKTRIYGKGGIAYVSTDMHDENDKAKFCPIYGLGFTYDLSPCVPIEIFWTQVYDNSLGNVNMFGVGLAYHFG